jgi:putative ABC transport system permease protein
MNFRVAVRSLRKSPSFAIVAVLTMTLGIGALSAMFSVVNAVLLKPLAGVETERIVRLSETLNGVKMARSRTYEEWRKLDIFDSIGARQYCDPNLTGMGEPQQLRAPCVTANWFAIWRTSPLLGRTFAPDEDQPGRAQVAVLAYSFWMTRFGGNSSVIGRTLILDEKPYTVVGVMPMDFLPFGKGSGDLYLPWVIAENRPTGVEVTARLRPGVSMDQTRAALAVVRARLLTEIPFEYKNTGGPDHVELLLETVVGPQRNLLRLLLGAAALVLLIATVNVANLFLARGAHKRREYEIRAFLGANRRQLIAPALMESSIIAMIGGGLGLLAASGLVRILAARLEEFPRAEEIQVDWRVMLVTLVVSLAAVFVCGAAPTVWRQRARWKTTRQSALVICEVALTVVLLISSGLLIRSFIAMRRVDLGYNPNGVALGFVSQPKDARDERQAAIALWQRVRARIAALPDVASVATTSATPAGGMNFGLPLIREGEGLEKAATSGANVVIASGEYFSTVGIPLLAGRTFDDHDSMDGAGVVMVSQSIANRYFNGAALGKRLRLPVFGFNITHFGDVTLREIIGVVGDVKENSLSESGRLTMYLPESQNAMRFTHVIIRAKAGDAMRLERQIRAVVYEEAPKLAIAPMLTLDQGNAYLTRTAMQAMWLLGAFAALALVLAGVGVHGVISYAAAQRTREMGIRMALGAQPAQLFGLVTRQALRLAMIGSAIGLAGAWAASRLLETLLFGVGRRDPATYIASGAVLIGIATIASFAPALRAARTDPSITLRTE